MSINHLRRQYCGVTHRNRFKDGAQHLVCEPVSRCLSATSLQLLQDEIVGGRKRTSDTRAQHFTTTRGARELQHTAMKSLRELFKARPTRRAQDGLRQRLASQFRCSGVRKLSPVNHHGIVRIMLGCHDKLRSWMITKMTCGRGLLWCKRRKRERGRRGVRDDMRAMT